MRTSPIDSTAQRFELPYEANAATYAQRLSQLPGMVFLDSRKRRAGMGQFDIIAAEPCAVLDASEYASLSNWMAAVEGVLQKVPNGYRSRLAIGYLDYDSCAAAHGVDRRQLIKPARVGVYPWHVLQDHQLGKAWLVTDASVTNAQAKALRERLVTAVEAETETFCLEGVFCADIARGDYEKNVGSIKELIAAGDCYQVNYAHRFSAQFAGDPFEAYLRLRDIAPGDFSAFLGLQADHAVLSLSPERFLSATGSRIRTQPIKGTMPRGNTVSEDSALARQLQSSTKDRAENVMITDLLRNDLGKFCKPGSVVTPELCQLHSYDNVHHLVSLVEGELAEGVTLGQLLLGCSPGGSITGAPKKRAMEIIRQFEPSARGVYCGSIFVMSNDGWLESSIAIRTLEAVGNTVYCWGGGGIVDDSVAASEYQETLDKIGGFMYALANSPNPQ